MNANFEYDKGSYPYQAVRFGEAGYKVLHMPTQQVVQEVKLPEMVASRVALMLNSSYYAEKAGAAQHRSDKFTVNKITENILHEEWELGDLPSHQLTTLVEALKA